MTRKISIDGSRRALSLLMVSILAISVIAGGAAMAAPSDDLSYEGDQTASNPTFDVDELTVAKHPMQQGSSDGNMEGYYDDSGDWNPNPEFVVNTTSDVEDGDNVNPYTFNPAHVEADFYDTFPRNTENTSALNATDWTTDESGTAGSISVSETSVADNVEAVSISTSSQTDGDTAVASYDGWSSELDSDESKRVLQVGGDVDTLDSGAEVQITLTDESGETKTAYINSSKDVSSDDVAAASTGSFVYQVKLSDLSTSGADDWDNIESVDIKTVDGDADVAISWLDVEKKGMTKLGVEKVSNPDDDGDFTEQSDIYQAQGDISVHSMSTLDSAYDDAVITDVRFPAQFRAEDIQGDEGDEEAYVSSFDDADQYPSFDTIMDTRYRMTLPDAIDLSYSGVTLQVEQSYPGERYVDLGVAEGVSDNANISDVSLTDKTGQLGSSGDTVTLDSTVQIGTNYVIGSEIKLTQAEADEVQDVGGAAAPPQGQSGGGVIGFFTSLPGALLSLAGGILSFRWLKSE